MSAQTTKSKFLSLEPEEIHRKLLENLDTLQKQYGVGRIGLFKFVELESLLSKMLGAKVDLVTRNALKPHIVRRILEEVRYVN